MADFPQSAPRTAQATYEEPQASLLSNILAIVGFIILIVVVIWGLVNLAGISSTWFSSLFGKSENVIEVTAPESATSGTPFSISWNYKEQTPGTYAFLYQCQGGFQLQTPGPTGGMNGIPCGAAFTIASVDNEVSVTPLLSGASALDVPVSIIFMPRATGTQAQGSATVKIAPAEVFTPVPAPALVPTPTPKPESTPKSTSSQTPKTPADLSVHVTSVTTDGYGNGSAVFDIANVGGTSSGTYYFTANLPTSSVYTYSSPAQTSLSPGSHIVSTLRFSQAVAGVFTVSITTPDINQSNNYASQSLNVPYNSYNYNNYNYPYSPYAQGYGGTQQAQYSAASYPSYQYQQYQTYMPMQTYQYNQYPYTQSYPYSTYYPYAY